MKLLIVSLLLIALSFLISIDEKLKVSNLSDEEKQVLVQERAEQQLEKEQIEALHQQKIDRVANTPWGELGFEDKVFRFLFVVIDGPWFVLPFFLLVIVTLFNFVSKARDGGYGH